jgi:hypothetical protein
MTGIHKYNQTLNLQAGHLAVFAKARPSHYSAQPVINLGFYLDIGRMIIDRQRGDTWDKAVVGNLANDLREDFPGLNGFSAANLWRMTNFYEAYGANEKLAQLV